MIVVKKCRPPFILYMFQLTLYSAGWMYSMYFAIHTESKKEKTSHVSWHFVLLTADKRDNHLMWNELWYKLEDNEEKNNIFKYNYESKKQILVVLTEWLFV
jgi:hypothetical protein